MEEATEEDQGRQAGHIRLGETRVPDRPSRESVGTLGLLCPEQDRHCQLREKHHRTADRGLPLKEGECLHQRGRDSRDMIFLLPGTHGPGSRMRTTTVMPNALLLQYDVLSMPLASYPQSLLVGPRPIFIPTG